MIKLQRKIRQKLLKEGKTTKYFKYAIGEVSFNVTGLLDLSNFKTKNQSFPCWKGTKGWVLR
ncbi:MAG: hypothetical protein ACJART_000960 [Maribacter sp.]|jgi:hypothetical protein|tara:strand:+ start:533 stop:718 length:186 start_codon:yes stop_codon:yes gene_type:complete